MKTKSACRLAAALILPLLLAVGCDSVDSIEQQPETSFKAYCFPSGDASGMSFTATGAMVDYGTVEGESLPWNLELEGPANWSGRRVLQGQQGNLVLHVEARLAVLGSRIAEGEFRIVEATSAYAGLQGHGTFELSVEASGERIEFFDGSLYGVQ